MSIRPVQDLVAGTAGPDDDSGCNIYGSEHTGIAGKASLSKFMHATIFCPFAGHTELWNIV